MKSLRFTASFAFALCLLLPLGTAACRHREEPPANTEPAMSEPAMSEPAPTGTESMAGTDHSVEATLQSNQPGVGGTVRFTAEPGGAGVRVVADVHGVKAGQHGFHVHETGDCSAKDYKSAGGHYNPTGAVHACPPTDPHHAGDFGNITVGPDGNGHMEMTVTGLSLEGANSVVGRAVILHAGTDDCKSQPAGNSGDRIACGVVQAAGGMGTEGH
jgi:superoxide dismutase, Cu-Zn family